MRRAILIASAIVAFIAAAVVATYEPPRERPPLQIMYRSEPPPLDASPAATIDWRRNCLVLADGRDFTCEAEAADDASAQAPAPAYR